MDNPTSVFIVMCVIAFILYAIIKMATYGKRINKIHEDRFSNEESQWRVDNLYPPLLKQYQALCQSLNRPEKVYTITASNFLAERLDTDDTCNIWRENNSIYMLTDWDSVEFTISGEEMDSPNTQLDYYIFQKSIPIPQIRFFIREGELRTETHISGGGGGGSSIGGAVVGGIIAGGAGAVIGSRKKNDPITSTTVEHDDRKVILYYQESTSSTELDSLEFTDSAYQVFMKLMPDKEYNTILAKEAKHSDTTVNTNAGDDIPAQIEKLADLRNKGILSEDEFQAKKTELLAKM